MGCNQSTDVKDSPKAAKSTANATSFSETFSAKDKTTTVVSEAILKEETIKLMFKTKKRKTVYHQGPDIVLRKSFSPRVIEKTPEQEKHIRSALHENFVFASVEEENIKVLINAMEMINVSGGVDLIIQGDEDCEYFYIVEKGLFSVLVDNVVVSEIGEGKSFGDLALLYDTPRQATVRAKSDCAVFRLDRNTFKITVANDREHRSDMIVSALENTPLLKNLTRDQLIKVAETVELVTYETGNEIVHKGDEGSIFYIVQDGEVSVEVDEKFKTHSVGPGGYFGERSLMTNGKRAATVRALRQTTLLTLDKDSFHKLLGPLQEVLDKNFQLRVVSSMKIFEKLSNRQKANLCRSFVNDVFPTGTVIIKQGDHGRHFYMIIEGFAEVFVNSNLVATLSAGEYFGEMALMSSDDVRKATVIAKTDCKCFHMDRDTFVAIQDNLSDSFKSIQAQRSGSLSQDYDDDHELDGVGHEEPSAQDISRMSKLQLKDLKRVSVLGAGSFGVVSLVLDEEGHVYALKAMNKAQLVALRQQKNVFTEKETMMACKSPFIQRLFTTFKDDTNLYFLLEFLQGGELFTIVHQADKDGVSVDAARFYTAGVLLAITHLHSKGFAYRDMKPENCMIDKFGYPRLIDFGFAKKIVTRSFTLCGTPEYLAPEIVTNKGHNIAVDYWALGVLIYEMIEGVSPFADTSGKMDQMVICKNIASGKFSFNVIQDRDCQDLIKQLLTKELHKRLGNLKDGPDGIRRHSWLKSIDFLAYKRKTVEAPWVPKVKDIMDLANFIPFEPEPYKPAPGAPKAIPGWDKDF